ncbi:MAG TPA: acetoacetate decarboxylase family protein [Actinomycetota bacterium]|nr:acetoacetate decarboxylase family protein [Actinomycetota bacterium]
MAELRGFMVPRSPEGRASIVPPPPWHYSGDVLTIEYRTDPARVAELLPEPLEPAEEDPGAVAVVFADWQSCSDSFQELLDPVRSQYRECFVVVRCRYRGTTYSRCVYIWVDKDFALARGWHQGYPKKLGSIWITRPVSVGRAGPRLAPGGRFGATLAANDRRLIEATFTIGGPSETAGFVNALPMLHHRFFPSIETGAPPSLDEVVTMRSEDVELGPAWTGEAELRLFEAPTEELARLEPEEMIAGYWRSVGATFRTGTRLGGTA